MAQLGAATGAMLLLTVLLGWWAVPVAALVCIAIDRRCRPGLTAAAAGLAWALLLGWQLLTAPAGRLAERLAGVLALPGWVVLAAGPVFAGLLAWSAATAGGALVSIFRDRRGTS